MSSHTDDERQEILSSMMLGAMPPLRKPGDFTLDEYIAQLKEAGYEVATKEPIRSRLEKLVESGDLAKLQVWDNIDHRSAVVYRPIPPA